MVTFVGVNNSGEDVSNYIRHLVVAPAMVPFSKGFQELQRRCNKDPCNEHWGQTGVEVSYSR